MIAALATTVRPNVQRTLDRLEPSPAFVLNRVADVVAWNGAYERLARPLGIVDGDRPNLARFTFADSRSRSVYPDWNLIADEQVANLRASTWIDDPAIASLFADLTETGREFTDRWEARPVAHKGSGNRLDASSELRHERDAYGVTAGWSEYWRLAHSPSASGTSGGSSMVSQPPANDVVWMSSSPPMAGP